MSAVEVGRICIKISGREAGRKCVIVDVIDENFVVITGPPKLTGVKRRRVNIGHIEPTKVKIEINRGATDEETVQALTSTGKLEDVARTVNPSKS